jgi:hypothetical protein
LPIFYFDYYTFFKLDSFLLELKKLAKFLNNTFSYDDSLAKLWSEFINHVFCITESSHLQHHIILCKNIHTMKDELLQIFYTFIRNKNISFIFTTQHVSFLPTTLKSKCRIIHLKKDIDYSTQYITYCNEIVEFVKQKKDDLFLLRELLYNLLTYNCNMHTCFYYIYSCLLRSGSISDKPTMIELIDIIQKYNTNYRPIYHLESFVICLLLNSNNSNE